jgi:thiosulfate sulfurtransferase
MRSPLNPLTESLERSTEPATAITSIPYVLDPKRPITPQEIESANRPVQASPETLKPRINAMEIAEVSTDTALARLEKGDAIFLDIRDAGSYLACHIPGALNIGSHNIDDFISTSDHSEPVIVYCYQGVSSRSAAAHLLDSGFEEVFSMSGGFAAWGDAPSESGPQKTSDAPADETEEPPALASPDEPELSQSVDSGTKPPSRRRQLLRRLRGLLKS